MKLEVKLILSMLVAVGFYLVVFCAAWLCVYITENIDSAIIKISTGILLLVFGFAWITFMVYINL